MCHLLIGQWLPPVPAAPRLARSWDSWLRWVSLSSIQWAFTERLQFTQPCLRLNEEDRLTLRIFKLRGGKRSTWVVQCKEIGECHSQDAVERKAASWLVTCTHTWYLYIQWLSRGSKCFQVESWEHHMVIQVLKQARKNVLPEKGASETSVSLGLVFNAEFHVLISPQN